MYSDDTFGLTLSLSEITSLFGLSSELAQRKLSQKVKSPSGGYRNITWAWGE